MAMSINKYITVVAFAMCMVSCNDFLDKQPTEVPSETTFWQKESDYESALAACYNTLYNNLLSYDYPCLDGLTDNGMVRFDEGTYGSAETIGQGDLTPNTGGFVTGIYNSCYQGIARVHKMLEHLEKYTGTDISDETKTQWYGELHALRGYFYSLLYQFYREVPLVTASQDYDNMYVPKASRDEIRQQIISDYDKAISELSDNLYYSSSSIGHFTKSAVQGLKARLLLFDAYDDQGNAISSKMKEIADLLKSIRPGYSLMPRLRDNFLSSKQAASTEIMFSVRFLQPNLLNNFDRHFGKWCCMTVSRNLIDEFECTDGLSWNQSPLAVHPDEKVLYGGSFDAANEERAKLFQNRDPRLLQTVYYNQRMNFISIGDEGGADGVKVNEDANLSPTNTGVAKYIATFSSDITGDLISDQDFPILRWAHVLLMLAESENELNGPDATALNAINEVRKRSNMPVIPSDVTKEELRQRIRHEWRVETAFEGLRYFQMRRWKTIASINGLKDPGWPAYSRVYKDAFYFLPIPQAEIDKSHGILIQDPNYE